MAFVLFVVVLIEATVPVLAYRDFSTATRYTNSWAVELQEGGNEAADALAHKYGFENYGQVTVHVHYYTRTYILASFPVPLPAFRRLQYGTASEEKLGVGLERGYLHTPQLAHIMIYLQIRLLYIKYLHQVGSLEGVYHFLLPKRNYTARRKEIGEPFNQVTRMILREENVSTMQRQFRCASASRAFSKK